jgi:predicted methyltransferase
LENWGPVACSAAGNKLVAAVSGGGIYTSQISTTSGAAGYIAGGQNSAVELQYIGGGQWIPISFVGALTVN